MGEGALAVGAEWESNCVILSGGQQGSNGIRLICGTLILSLFLIFKTSVPFTETP
jgi:hypothetical protein